MASGQLTFDYLGGGAASFPTPLSTAIEELAERGDLEARGAVFTRPEVVEFILDLAGYTVDHPLYKQRLLEPSFGGGEFLLPAIKRLLTSWRAAKEVGSPLDELGEAIRAVELHRETFHATYAAVVDLLKREGIEPGTAVSLADSWLIQGDFLLVPLPGQFDFVVGNPPYVRQELIPAPLLAEYRCRYQTIYDRADLYVPFIERSLDLLAKGGSLGFICADRWMKNRYGGPLRRLVAKNFHLKILVDMTGTQAFHSEVSAYPAITIITREVPGPTRIAHRPPIERSALAKVGRGIARHSAIGRELRDVRELACVTSGAEPWLARSRPTRWR